MGRQKKWSVATRSPFTTIRGCLGPKRKGVEGLCVSSLLGVLRSHTWLIGEEEVAWLLARTSLPRYQHHRAHSLSFSLCSSSADGGSEDLADPRSPSLDPHLSHVGQGGSIDSDCAFEGDYTVPPLSITEGMQHIRIMEGVSRSLPSSPLLTHQTISVRLQPVKKLTELNWSCISTSDSTTTYTKALKCPEAPSILQILKDLCQDFLSRGIEHQIVLGLNHPGVLTL
ncbi:hypothetical protein PAMP_010090 [Pampus punctatissimus]